MENAVEAIKMGFGMMVFVIAISATMYLFTSVSSTSQVILYSSDKTNYYDNIKFKDENKEITTRIVNVETIIPTLYRYYKENFAVQIFNRDGKLVQIFDLNIEGKVYDASNSKIPTDQQRALLSLYGVSGSSYLFEAPWLGGNTTKDDIKTRIDLYVNGACGYINGKKVDYTTNSLKSIPNNGFYEQFTQYAYKGDTISVGEGDAIETITGNTKTDTKIVISYQAI